MKIAVSSYSFSQALRDGRMSYSDVIPKAKDMGYQGVEIVRPNISTDEMRALAPKLKAQSEEYELPIIAYMVGADFLKNGLDDEVSRLKGEVEITALLGASRMRHDSTAGAFADGRQATISEALPIVADGYRRVTEYAVGLGVHTMIENHGYFFQDSHRVKTLIETVGHKNFGWLVDIGNFMCADEKPVDAVRVGAPMAVHAHAKDFHFKKAGEFIPEQGWFGTRGGNFLRGAIIGHGEVNVPECLKILTDTGYDGYLSVEFEGIEDCIMALAADLTNLKRML